MQEKNLTILIVDDELSIRTGLNNSIPWQELNITVLNTAKDGLEAFDFIEKYQPDIVLTDIRMPKCDGLELIQMVRNKKIETSFIIISGYDDFKYAQKALNYGVKSYLLKPIIIDDFIEEIKKLRDSILAKRKKTNEEIQNRKNQSLNNIALKNIFLTRLIQNEFKHLGKIEQNIKTYQLNLQNKPLYVLVFEISNVVPENSIHYTDFQSDILIVTLTLEELLQDIPSVVFEYSNHQVLAIINIPDDSFDVYKLCEQFSFFIQKYTSIDLSIGIGEKETSLLHVSHSYQMAMQVLAYRLYEINRKIFNSDIISNVATPNISTNTYDNQRLIDAIYRNDLEDITLLTDDYIDSLFYIEMPPPNYIRGMCIYLIISIHIELGNFLNQQDHELASINTEINKYDTITKIKEWMISLFFSYAKAIELRKTINDPIIEKAKLYIKKNLLSNVKAEEVAEHVNLSANYFTSYFNEKTNITFRDYILDLKMQYAKELLRERELTINEISQLLGYTDYRSFHRAFKKFTNMTPSKFQQLY